MIFTVVLTATARANLARIDRVTAGRIVAAIQRYAATGHGHVIPLKGRPGEWRMRMGDWRVIFTRHEGEKPDDRKLIVSAIRPRGGAYQD